MKDPTMPINIVTRKPPGSRPGVSSFAITPTTTPNTIHIKIAIVPPIPKEFNTSSQCSRTSGRALSRTRPDGQASRAATRQAAVLRSLRQDTMCAKGLSAFVTWQPPSGRPFARKGKSRAMGLRHRGRSWMQRWRQSIGACSAPMLWLSFSFPKAGTPITVASSKRESGDTRKGRAPLQSCSSLRGLTCRRLVRS